MQDNQFSQKNQHDEEKIQRLYRITKLREENRNRSLQEAADNARRGREALLVSNDPYQLRYAAPPAQDLVIEPDGGTGTGNPASTGPKSYSRFNQNQTMQEELAQITKTQEEKQLFPASDIHFNKHIRKIENR